MARNIFSNKKALRDYTIVDKLEAGIVLDGWEVKSVKNGMGDFRGAFAIIDHKKEVWLRGVNIARWKTGLPKKEEEQKRERKLLLHKKETNKLIGLTSRPGYTLVPIEVYVNDSGIVKVNLAVVKGKRQYERKQDIKIRDMNRRVKQHLQEN